MKVVLFCGGFGMRLREFSESIPKPMVPIGYRPILWHVMKYYAHFGHKDFILCLGWQANVIKDYFLHYDECVSNNFVLTGGGKQVSLLSSDIDDWKITFVDTGHGACIGERLRAVAPFVQDEERFLANYTDGLSNVSLPDIIDFHASHKSVGTFVAVKPTQSFHAVSMTSDGTVRDIKAIAETDTWMNGGYFVLTPEIFDYLRPGEDLVGPPFMRLTEQSKLSAYKHLGFWSCMDTYKEKQTLDEMYDCGNPPWALWANSPAA